MRRVVTSGTLSRAGEELFVCDLHGFPNQTVGSRLMAQGFHLCRCSTEMIHLKEEEEVLLDKEIPLSSAHSKRDRRKKAEEEEAGGGAVEENNKRERRRQSRSSSKLQS